MQAQYRISRFQRYIPTAAGSISAQLVKLDTTEQQCRPEFGVSCMGSDMIIRAQ